MRYPHSRVKGTIGELNGQLMNLAGYTLMKYFETFNGTYINGVRTFSYFTFFSSTAFIYYGRCRCLFETLDVPRSN